MKRILLSTLLSVVVVAVAPSGAGANHSQGQGSPKQDSVAGSGKIEQFGTFVHVNAHGAPDGSDAKGSFFVRQTFFRLPLDFSGKVTCLLVTGNKAIVGGEVTKNQPVEPGGVLPNPAPGTGVLIDVRDNDGNGTPDTYNFTFRPTPPETCPNLNSHQFAVDQGNFHVHDSTL
jgi:hypothetical protein